MCKICNKFGVIEEMNLVGLSYSPMPFKRTHLHHCMYGYAGKVNSMDSSKSKKI